MVNKMKRKYQWTKAKKSKPAVEENAQNIKEDSKGESKGKKQQITIRVNKMSITKFFATNSYFKYWI